MTVSLAAALAYYPVLVEERQKASDTLRRALLPDAMVEECLCGFDRACDILSAIIAGHTTPQTTLTTLLGQFAGAVR